MILPRRRIFGHGLALWLCRSFFQGIISLCQALEMPFRDHRDGLDPDWALMTTERQTFGCLSGGEAGGPAPPDSLNLMQPAGTASPLAPSSPAAPHQGWPTASADLDDFGITRSPSG